VVFVVLNIILAVLLFWFSTIIDTRNKKHTANYLANMVIILAFTSIVIALSLLVGMNQQSYFVSAMCRAYLFGLSLQVVLFTVYVWHFPEENKTFFSEWKKLQVLGPKVTIDEVYKDLNRCRYGMLCPVKGYCSIECPDRTGGANVEMNAAMFEKCKDSFYKIMRGTNVH